MDHHGQFRTDTSGAGNFALPIYLFDKCVATSRPKHSCLLVLNELDAIFQPAAVLGLDNTTRRRLRIPNDIIEQQSSLCNGRSVTLRADDRLFLEPFFSVREYGTFTKIDLSPLLHENRLLALFMIAHDKVSQNAPSRLLNFSEGTGANLYKNYISKLRPLPPLPERDDDESVKAKLQTLKQHLAQTKRSLLICSVALDAFQQTVLPHSTTVDPLKFELDVLRVLHSLASASGFYHRKGRNEVTLGFSAATNHNREFLQSHLLLSLGDFYPRVQLTSSIFRSCTFLDYKDITIDLLTANI